MEEIPSNQELKKKQSRTAKLFNSFSKKNPFSNKEIFSINNNPRRHGTFHKKSNFKNIYLKLFDNLNNLDLFDVPLTDVNENYPLTNNRISMINPLNNPEQLRKSSLSENKPKSNDLIFDDNDIYNDNNNSFSEIKSNLKFSEDNDDIKNKNYMRFQTHTENSNNLSIQNPFKDPILKPPKFHDGSRLEELWKYEEILIEYNIIDFTCNLIFMLFF